MRYMYQSMVPSQAKLEKRVSSVPSKNFTNPPYLAFLILFSLKVTKKCSGIGDKDLDAIFMSENNTITSHTLVAINGTTAVTAQK